jgi:DHA1 family bicyclomycin/chloramphenicol resistance-like MFS transporter
MYIRIPSAPMSGLPSWSRYKLVAHPAVQVDNGFREKEFLAIVALLMAIAVLAINMILPAFDQITTRFGLTGSSQAGLTVSLLYLGLALGQVTLGPVSDAIGRKNALMIGITIFLAGCLISGTATDFKMLIAGQIIQGLGLGAPRVITLAILRDRFTGNKMASAMSFVMMMFVVAPTFAPFVGKLIVSMSSWRMLFAAYGALGISLLLLVRLRLPETLPKDRRQSANLKSMAKAQIAVLKNTGTIGYSVALGVISGPFIAYLNMSQELFEFQYGLGTAYPILFALISLAIGAASFVNGVVVQRIGMTTLTSIALAAIVLMSIAASAVILATKENLPLEIFVAYMAGILFCFGLLVSNLNALAMAQLTKSAGTGAASIGALTTIISVPVAVMIGWIMTGNAAPVTVGFVICGLIAFALHKAIQSAEHDTA